MKNGHIYNTIFLQNKSAQFTAFLMLMLLFQITKK